MPVVYRLMTSSLWKKINKFDCKQLEILCWLLKQGHLFRPNLVHMYAANCAVSKFKNLFTVQKSTIRLAIEHE